MARYSTPRAGKARKYYLSDAAIAALEAEAQRTTWSMSVILDMLIKKHIKPPAAEQPEPPADETMLTRVVAAVAVEPPIVATAKRRERQPIPHSVPERAPSEPARIEDQKPVPNKKDFDLDI